MTRCTNNDLYAALVVRLLLIDQYMFIFVKRTRESMSLLFWSCGFIYTYIAIYLGYSYNMFAFQFQHLNIMKNVKFSAL